MSEQDDVDAMLRQAELLSQKMRSSRQNIVDSVVDEADDSDASIDDMLRRAEMLSRQMISPSSSPPRGNSFRKSTSASESTPGLIRQSEEILSKLPNNQVSTSEYVNTPELMKQTEQLLGKMKAAYSSNHQSDSHVRQNGSSNKASKTDTRTDTERADELRRLMEEALSNWSGSGEQKGRVKNALEQIVGSGSTPITPSTVSVQHPEGDDISSVGSLSPRTRKQSNARATSLLYSTGPGRPPPTPSDSRDIDAAEELVRNMAMALQETRSMDSSEEMQKKRQAITPASPIRRPEGEVSSLHDDQPTPPKRAPPYVDKRGSDPPTAPSLGNEYSIDHSSRDPPGSVTKRKPGPPARPPLEQKSSSVSFTPNRMMSAEEAQYNAIMAAIDSSGGGGKVRYEKVTSAGAEDDDYVPMADYSKKGGTRSLGVGTFDIPVIVGRSPRIRRRRRKIGRIIVAFIALVAVGYVAKSWLRIGVPVDETEEPTIKSKEPIYFEEVEYEAFDEPDPVPVPVTSSVIVIRGPSPWYRVRKVMAKAARHARRQFLRCVIKLTPPWERGDYEMNWIGPP